MKKFFHLWQGALGVLIAFGLFWVSESVLRLLDPTAGTFDYGYLQKPFLTAIYLLFLSSISWIIFQLEFPSLDRWLDNGGFKDSWDALDSAKKVDRFLVILLGIFLGAVAILISL